EDVADQRVELVEDGLTFAALLGGVEQGLSIDAGDALGAHVRGRLHLGVAVAHDGPMAPVLFLPSPLGARREEETITIFPAASASAHRGPRPPAGGGPRGSGCGGWPWRRSAWPAGPRGRRCP